MPLKNISFLSLRIEIRMQIFNNEIECAVTILRRNPDTEFSDHAIACIIICMVFEKFCVRWVKLELSNFSLLIISRIH